jgi:hypothetical protein
MSIILTKWLNDRQLGDDFRQSNFRDVGSGVCITASLSWINKCMIQDANHTTGKVKYITALDELRQQMDAVVVRHRSAEKAKKVGEIEMRKFNELSKSELATSEVNQKILNTIFEEIQKTPKENPLLDGLIRQFKNTKNELLESKRLIEEYNSEQNKASTIHLKDLSHDVKIATAYDKVATDFHINLHAGFKGDVTDRFANQVCGHINPSSYFLYKMAGAGDTSHALGGYRSDGAGWGPFSGTSYLTIFDPNLGLYRCPFADEGASLINNLHRAYRTDDDDNILEFPKWELILASRSR